ncbi:hypothetical protein TcasGA2_TC033400 [Tribolium castaneum]|uniref:Uncharacterized protein n=1 Tax=Tribolium castaneum TaxID=7070 RepID=A0A139WGI0_TRICA|nr:hypothetical protein TcasGA2_TC033400 [Tribolium castaneum]
MSKTTNPSPTPLESKPPHTTNPNFRCTTITVEFSTKTTTTPEDTPTVTKRRNGHIPSTSQQTSN